MGRGFKKFINDVNEIILKTPPLTDNIYCLIAYKKYEDGSAEPFEKNSFNNRHKNMDYVQLKNLIQQIL